jgi:Ca2+/Na+ antiporter
MTEDDVTESLRTPLLDEPISPEEDEEAHSEETNQESAEPVEDEGTANDNDGSNDPSASLWYKALHTPLLPDPELTIQGEYLVEGSLPIKLLKFIGLTFAMIAMVHWFVRTSKHFSSDRDRNLKFWQIWVFEGNFIVSDCIIFFVVGRLWRQRGIDHLAWIVSAILCNVYFESQHFFSWLRHSVTLYEMHCIWPWQLWVFASLLVPLIGGIVFLHAIKAYQDRILYIKFLELAFFGLFYLGPTISSPYFHFHHW